MVSLTILRKPSKEKKIKQDVEQGERCYVPMLCWVQRWINKYAHTSVKTDHEEKSEPLKEINWKNTRYSLTTAHLSNGSTYKNAEVLDGREGARERLQVLFQELTRKKSWQQKQQHR